MREIANVRQRTGESRRRWFYDDYFELVVWFREAGAITQFELSYDLDRDWRAIRWKEGTACTHYRVDDGEDRPHRNAAPMLRTTSGGPPDEVFTRFAARCSPGGLEAEIGEFVVGRLGEWRFRLQSEWAPRRLPALGPSYPTDSEPAAEPPLQATASPILLARNCAERFSSSTPATPSSIETQPSKPTSRRIAKIVS